ncbi:MAG: antibiotic biosynthesis monooxygenase [Acidobacteria bacterium]|nr:antibiotic biosynthesis monooxygenase [Acidobacteriota bacterium]
MHARVTQYRLRPGKRDEFYKAIESMRPKMHQQEGFRGLIVLRNAEDSNEDETVISLWNTLDNLRATEKNMYLYQALARALTLCEGFPQIREQEVLITDFPTQ